MGTVERQEEEVSGAAEGQEEMTGNFKLVPVTESIRYRRRAQSAEKEVEALSEQLAAARQQTAEMAEQLKSLQMEQKLVRKLAAAGAVDLESAVLIAKARMEGQQQETIDSCIEQLRREKQYLFGDNHGRSLAITKRTSAAKDVLQDKQTVIEKAARKAAVTGSRTDLQQYLKLRRNFV